VATDIVILTHNRLDHLEATVDALERHTPEPIRITVVDNASGPELRNWLAANRERFHDVILRPANEYTAAFQHGIDATSSDPFVVTDPDIVVPDLQPSWLAQMLALMERHPDFGLLGIGLEGANRPPVLDPEVIDPATVVGDHVVETPVGTVMMMLRRGALSEPFSTDWETCRNVARDGRRVGWAKDIRAVHLGWDDWRLHPAHLAHKQFNWDYGIYREVGMIARPPSVTELALAAPAIAATRAAGVPDAAVLELAWGDPVVGPAVPDAVAVRDVDPAAPPFEAGAAGATVLVDPPPGRGADALAAATRLSARLVVAIAGLEAFDARPAGELAPDGWTGRELSGTSDVALAMARAVDADPAVAVATVEDRERWLTVFAEAAFGPGTRRLWVWERDEPLDLPERVTFDAARVQPWRGEAMTVHDPRRISPLRRQARRARRSVNALVGRLRRR